MRSNFVHLHEGHLGSLPLMTYSGGALVADSMARFLPFGAYRSDGSGPVDAKDLSDRGFTGHYENRGIGLTYMQARYYAPELRRFISADTLVPDPGASIGYNRFAYVGQNPINLNDPSGHCGADQTSDSNEWQQLFDLCQQLVQEARETYGIDILGKWKLEEVHIVILSFQSIVEVFQKEGIADGVAAFRNVWSGTEIRRVRDVYANPAYTISRNLIEVYDSMFRKIDTRTKTLGQPLLHATSQKTIIHELAHVWDRRSGRQLSRGLRNLPEVNGRYTDRFLWFGGTYEVDDLSPYNNLGLGGSSNPVNPREDWAQTFAAFVVDEATLHSLNSPDGRTPYVSQTIRGLGAP
jgi:RHS repeat-associated protein